MNNNDFIEPKNKKYIPQNTFVVQPYLYEQNTDYEYKLQEAINLTKALNLCVQGSNYNKLREINPSTYLSKGFLEGLQEFIIAHQIDVLVINSTISAIQQRNLEKLLNIKVIDRNGLIISIFEDRAQSKEGKLQAELASLTYQKSRIVKAWSHLERQRGGGGFIGGPGEKQKELDKRIITNKISQLEKALDKVKLTRSIQNNSRKKFEFKTVALVGYTNAGKSTLFNELTLSDVFAKDLLFATLDPTRRTIQLANQQQVILIDTVGFISDLPHNLIDAFHSTLDEIKDADVILHVIDVSHSDYQSQIDAVKSVLLEIGISENQYIEKAIEVYNKTDKIPQSNYDFIKNTLQQKTDNPCLMISAIKKTNLQSLNDIIYSRVTSSMHHVKTSIFYEENQIIVSLFKCSSVIKKTESKEYTEILFLISNKNLEILKKDFPLQKFEIYDPSLNTSI